MDAQTGANAPSDELASVLKIIGELAHKSQGGGYIYRGENREYSKVSSTLYRRYQDIEVEGFDLEVVQREMLLQAMPYTRYTGESGELEVLSQLQHNGGATNLIDFTTDFLIALFFACDGEPDKAGRVVLLREAGEGYSVAEPSSPAHRVIAQKSVFVRPAKGFVEPDDKVIIDRYLKPAVLHYLREGHGVFTETIYNDLHGFIRHQGIHQSTYIEFYRGVTSREKGEHEQAIEHYSNAIRLNPQLTIAYNNRGVHYFYVGNYNCAIADYETALQLDPEYANAYNNLGNVYLVQNDYDNAIINYEIALQLNPEHANACNNLGIVHFRQANYGSAIEFYTYALSLDTSPDPYYNRGEARLALSEWDAARADLITARDQGVDIVAAFRNDYANVANFEERIGVILPPDIAEMLGG